MARKRHSAEEIIGKLREAELAAVDREIEVLESEDPQRRLDETTKGIKSLRSQIENLTQKIEDSSNRAINEEKGYKSDCIKEGGIFSPSDVDEYVNKCLG